MTCTIISGIADQLAQIHNETLLAASLRLCKMLPSGIENYCIDAVKTLEPILVNPCLKSSLQMHSATASISAILTLNLAVASYVGSGLNYNGFHHHLKRIGFDFCSIPGIHELCEMFDRSWSRIRPAVDADGDWFSIVSAARGSFWRGRDCHDWDLNSYPGRQPLEGDATADFNCNGIWGVDKDTGRPWEEILCKDYEPRGIVYIGDSVGAHFHFPEPWINPLLISEGLTDSVYLRLRARNRCNHRDYQNLSRNGASSYDGMTYVESLARNQSRDKPALVVYGMYGNDVCNRFTDSVPHMTTPKAFHQNVMNVLNVLNNTLPFGSHVLLVALVDGGFIYPTMAKRIHPLGQLHGNIHYSDRAQELTDTLKNIVSTEKFSAFSLHIIDNPIQKVMWDWTKRGKPTAHPLLADVLWKDLLKNLPEVLGDKNPHNERIKELFGDQGGH
ncbi:Acyloxyacyl hydrolase [Blattella germanica]|nr:Acyloxyacyl hydrolase [Blattella germanica]